MNREESGTFAAGSVLLLIGAALLLDRLGVVPWTSQWSVWPLLLIGFGVASLVDSPWHGVRGVFPIALGLWLWAAEAGWLPLRDSWPLIFVMLGVAVMWQTWAAPPDAQARIPGLRRQRNPVVALAIVAAILAATTMDARRYVAKADTARASDRLHVVTMLGRTERASGQEPFKGGDMLTVMGESTLDLRQANVADGEDVTVDLFAMMGSIVVRVPDGWLVEVQTVPVAGTIVDRRGLPDAPPRARARNRGGNGDDWVSATPPVEPLAPLTPVEPGAHVHRLILTGTVMMGSVIIRS